MGKLMQTARAHVGVTAVGAVLLLGGGVATAAVVVTPAADSQVVEPAPETTEPAATSSAPTAEPAPTLEPAPVPEPVVTPVEEVPAATVEPMPTAQNTPPAAPPTRVIPEGHRLPDMAPGQEPEGVGTIGPDGNYTPAPAQPERGEPPVDGSPRGEPAELLPGEPGYVPAG